MGNVFATQPDTGTHRIGIFVGSNNGGRDRVLLRYAVSDAVSIKNVFLEMGGIANDDSVLLAEPSIREINRRIDAMHQQVLRSKEANRRTEVIFYYSGHSDEEGLLLNREKYTYRALRNRINSIPADMRIVILDSCASGAFTRIKGGERTLPFLVDSSFTAEGHAFLTSSSANEASQESDRIGASFFTHSLVAGLRGAADTVGDRRVTLNELYRYAYTETLARTETSLHGAQHANYDIQISGSGDLVLTDVSRTTSGIVFDENLTGRLTIRNSRDQLIAEVTKTTRPLELGLEPGVYRITLQQGSDVSRADVTLAEGRRTTVTINNFTRTVTETTRLRGDNDSDSANAVPNAHLYTFFFNVVHEPFYFPLIGFINIANGNHNNFQAGYINWNTGNFKGFQAGFVNTVGGNFSGFQAGFVNTNIGQTNGFQSGFVNTAINEMEGLQIGFVNVAVSSIRGFQLGFVNYADSIDGIPIGFISIVREGGYMAIEYSFTESHTYNAAFKIGIEKFYTNINIAYNHTSEFSYNNLASGIGFGSIFPVIGKLLYINTEINSLFSIGNDVEKVSYNSLGLYLGVNIGKLSIAAGPSLTWIYKNWWENIQPLEERPAYFSFYNYDIDEYNRLVVGGRIAARLRF
ncbi:MAG: caspase family protein [Treponema sp.]|nr:caspase family protein [Treponema sp.]MCL2237671.1 caspase family protein [Treponema sp.]